MLHLALALLLTGGPADADRPCVLQGKLTLQTPKGAAAEAEGKTVVYVEKVPHRVWRQVPTTRSVNQLNKQFAPQVMVLQAGDSVQFENEDNVEHSVFSNSDTKTFDLKRSAKGVTGTELFPEPGMVRLQCDIHPEMRADLLVLQNPFFSQPAADGTWKIDPLPAGEYRVVAWEINGATVKSPGKVKCDGPTTVELPVLKQKPAPVPQHKDGSYYSDTYHH